jgi:hypothetical protein
MNSPTRATIVVGVDGFDVRPARRALGPPTRPPSGTIRCGWST